MAELQVNRDENPGILKEIDSGAIDLIFQAIQEDIYSYPIKSFVRESISNGLDAFTERNIHFKIEEGEPIEKYFRQESDEKLLKDSSYDPSYYNGKYLSKVNRVDVIYKEKESGRDEIKIKDYGVGLGGDRLKGFFKLGYSSKRNMKDVIGKFGAGAKSGLATGVEYFIMHTVYNGYRTSFMIFKNDYENITPKSDSTIEEVWSVKMASGLTQDRSIYWEPTHEKNGVEIVLEVKKHNRKKFIDAVKDQFQYFNGKVRLVIEDEDGLVDESKLDDAPLFESDTILIPQYSTHFAPHILVDGISYGPVSWEELELERRGGKIAIKVRATDVDITQSRESLKWTEKTKKVILKAVQTAQEEAEGYVTKFLELKNEDNIFEVLNKYSAISKNSDDYVTGVFGDFLNMYSIKPKFTLNIPNYEKINVYLGSAVFELLFYPFDVWTLELTREGKISKTKVDTFSSMQNRIIIFAEEKHVGPKLVAHLLSVYDVDSIVYIKRNVTRTLDYKEYAKIDWKIADINTYMKDIFKKYVHVYVDEYDVQYDEKEGDLDTGKVSQVSQLALERKKNEEVLYQVFGLEMPYSFALGGSSRGHYAVTAYQNKHTIKKRAIKETFENVPNLVICTGKYKFLGRLIEVADLIYPQKGFKMIYVAEPLVPLFAPYGTVITDYFRNLNPKTNELMVGEHIRTLNTYMKVKELYDKYESLTGNEALLSGLTDINASKMYLMVKSAKYADLKAILRSLGVSASEDAMDDILGYLKSIAEFQDTLATLDQTQIASKALELFGSDKVHHINAYDKAYVTQLEEELERLMPLEPLLAKCVDGHDYKPLRDLVDKLLTFLEN